MADTLPPSPASKDSDAQQIFLRPDGTNWQIFVEAGRIPGGFKLRRLLKKAGAVICSDPRQSQVILVDSSTDEGRLFIRDWGTDENKVVLEYSWVNSCISEGRVLDESHQWGGFLTHDDGLPIVKEEDIPKSPFPTPRDTPEDAVVLSRGCAKQDEQNVVPTSATKVPRPTTVRSQSPTGVMQPPGSIDPLNHHQYSESQQIFTNIPPSHYPSVQPMAQQVPLPAQGYPMDIRTFVDFLSKQSDPRIGAQYAPLLVANAVSGGTWPWVPLLDQNAHANLPKMMNSHHADSSSLPNAYASSIGPLAQATDLQDVPPFPTLPPSIRRKSPVVSRSSSESQAIKGKRRSRAGSSGYLPSAESSSAPRRTSASRQSSSHRRTLFTSSTGKELSFFVQVDLKDRQLTINAVKKNGGILSSDHAVADYCVLYSRSTTFKDLRRSTHAAGRPPVNASFVHDCVAQNMLLDPAPYLFPLPSSPSKKRKREVLAGQQSKDTSQAKKLRGMASQVEPKQLKKEENSPVSKIKPKKEDRSPMLKMITLDNGRIGARSPTPPPEESHVQLTRRGVKYSEHERDYALRYVEVLLERDHQMSANAIAANLFRKVPSHSLASWRSFLVRTVRDDVELIRKRKSIAYRKARRTDQGDREQIKVEQSQDQSLDQGPSTSSPYPAPVSGREDVRKQEDLATLSRFFATREEEEEEEDADVWACLTSQATCQSALSWEEFYTQHHEEVNARFNELTNPMPDDSSTGGYHPDLHA